MLRVGAQIVAPSTLLVALLYYFGNLHAQGLFRYLRVNFSIFDLTTTDYLIRSADGLFVPVTAAAATALLLVWTARLLRSRRDAPHPVARAVLVAFAAVTGLSLLGLAAAATLAPDVVLPGFREAGGLGLSFGVLLVAYAVRVVRLTRADGTDGASAGAALVEWAAIFVLVSIGLFWAVNSYAIGVGTSRGMQIEQNLASSPDVVIYAAESLGIRGSGIREVNCPGTGVAFPFRYEGLKFVFRSGDQYLFLPASWTRAQGATLVVPRTDGLRLEFSAPGTGTGGSC